MENKLFQTLFSDIIIFDSFENFEPHEGHWKL